MNEELLKKESMMFQIFLEYSLIEAGRGEEKTKQLIENIRKMAKNQSLPMLERRRIKLKSRKLVHFDNSFSSFSEVARELIEG